MECRTGRANSAPSRTIEVSMELVRVKSVRALDDFVVHVEFTNGTEREIDVSKYFHGPVIDEIRSDPQLFRSVRVDPTSKTLSWDNGADIDPDTLYYELTPAWMISHEVESLR